MCVTGGGLAPPVRPASLNPVYNSASAAGDLEYINLKSGGFERPVLMAVPPIRERYAAEETHGSLSRQRKEGLQSGDARAGLRLRPLPVRRLGQAPSVPDV